MLTSERVLGTKWRYSMVRSFEDTDEVRVPEKHRTKFEVLEVDVNGKLGIFIYEKSTDNYKAEPDVSELDDLTLDKLDELVQKKFVRELTDQGETAEREDGNWMRGLTYIGALLLFCLFGVATFAAGVSAQNHAQKPWEAAIGAAFMIAAVLAIAIRR